MKKIRRTTVDIRTAQDRCEICGEVNLTNDMILVRFCENDAAKHQYVFACPICSRPIAKPLDMDSLAILVENGCPMERWQMPKEIFEPKPEGKLTPDDALDFHFIIQDDEAVAKFFGTQGAP